MNKEAKVVDKKVKHRVIVSDKREQDQMAKRMKERGKKSKLKI